MTDRDTHRPLLLVAALLVAGIAAGSWLWRGREVEPVASAPVASEPAPTPSEPPAVSDVRTEAPPRAEPASVGLRVLVQDRGKRPVAGAAITVTGDDPDLAFPPTDSDGWTRAPRLPNGNVHLKVTHGRRTGSASWRWTATLASEVTIWLNSDRDVEVTVANASGAPHAGAKVGLFAGRETEWRSPSATAVTDDAGIARFHVSGHTWLGVHEQVRAVALLSNPTAAEPVAWTEPGPTRITIVAERAVTPAGPQLHVRFVERDGSPVDVQGRLDWSRIQSNGAGTAVWPAGEVAVAGRDAMVTQLLDRDHLRLYLWEQGRLASQLEVTVPPGASTHEVTLSRGLVAPRLEIPLVDRDGKAVTAGAFIVTVLLANGSYEDESTLQPDVDGLLVVTLEDTAGGSIEVAEKRDAARFHWPEVQRLKRPYRSSIGKEPPPNPPLAVLQFETCAAGERRRLPPVTVPNAGPSVVGVVVDGDGKPVPGVRIWMTTITAPEPEPFAAFATTTDAQGHFAIRATSLPDEVFVCGRKPLGFCAPVRVRPSAEPVTLRLQPTGAIALDLRWPERPPLPEAVATQLRPFVALRVEDDELADGWWAFHRERSDVYEGKWRARWVSRAPVPERGEVLFRDLVPGVYQVVGSVGHNRVLEFPGVRVLAGETTRPPQAQGVAIGGGVEPGIVRVRDGEGRPVADARVHVQMPQWEPFLPTPEMRATDANGEAWFVVPRGAVAGVEVTAAGRAPVSLHGATFPLDVAIGAGTSLDFAITGQAEAARQSRALVVVCSKFDGKAPASPVQKFVDTEMFAHPQANLDASGHATIPNLPAGTYRLWLGAVPPLEGRRSWTFVLLGDRTITAGDPARVTIEHAVTAEQTATLRGK